MPSAPPLHVDLETVLEGEGDLLSLEPPTWIPDSHAGDCSACHEAFRCRSRAHKYFFPMLLFFRLLRNHGRSRFASGDCGAYHLPNTLPVRFALFQLHTVTAIGGSGSMNTSVVVPHGVPA